MTEQDLLIQDLRRANDILRAQILELEQELKRQTEILKEVREEADRFIKERGYQ